MIITICGSMQFHREMSAVEKQLKELGHQVLTPGELDNQERNESYMKSDEERITAKIEYDFIREHFRKIEQAEAVLVLNYPKKDTLGYIGGNTFLEMGYAFGLNKKIYLLYAIPQMDYYTEMRAMQPIILEGDLTKIS